MADPTPRKPNAARVDSLVDENGARLDVPDDSALRTRNAPGSTVGATGPTNWWRIGLVVMAALIALLLILQLVGGNPGTDVQPGTPVAAPEVPAPDA